MRANSRKSLQHGYVKPSLAPYKLLGGKGTRVYTFGDNALAKPCRRLYAPVQAGMLFARKPLKLIPLVLLSFQSLEIYQS